MDKFINQDVLGNTTQFQQSTTTAPPPQHCLSGIEDSLASAVGQADQLYGRTLQVADYLLGAEPQTAANAACSPISNGRIGSFEDRLTRLQSVLGILSYEMSRIERAVQ